MFASGTVNHEQWAMRIVDMGSQRSKETLFYLFGAERKFIPPRTCFARLLFAASFLSRQPTYRSLPIIKATSPQPSTPTIPITSLHPTAISSDHPPFNKVTRPRRRISLVVPGI